MYEHEHEHRLQKLENGHDILSRDCTRLNDAIVKISDSLTQLVVIQEQNKTIIQCTDRHAQSFEKLEDRISAIEMQMPQLLESRKFLVSGVVFVVSAVLLSLVALVVK